VSDAAEPDETSVRDLGGERLAVADREERVVPGTDLILRYEVKSRPSPA
jgi:hypothetical protein